MAETRIVCSKCGRSEEFSAALASGWLYRQRAGEPEGYMVIRCPAHISEHARRLAGLPQKHRTRRVQDNLDRGLWAEYGSGEYIAAVGEDGDGRHVLSFHRAGMPAHKSESFASIDELIAAMREVEPDLRKWKLCEEV
jgi:hypothetical protein